MAKRKVDEKILKKCLAKNMSIQEIADLLDVNINTVYTYGRKFNITNRKKRLTKDQIINIKRLYAEGYPSIKLAEMFNVDQSTIVRKIKLSEEELNKSLKKKINEIPLEEQKKIKELRNKGLYINQIAKEVGRSPRTVFKYIHKDDEKAKEKEE